MKITVPKFNWRSNAYGSISLCMIMKNEAKYLSRCLNSVRGLVDEIIIVDTGSADSSISIARSHGAEVLNDPWRQDFARPRNIGIGRASCDWILILDPDEVLLKKHHQAIQELTRAKGIAAFQMETRNYNRDPLQLGFRTVKEDLGPLGQVGGFVPSTKTRFFRNGLGIRFEGCWHELADYYIARNRLPGLKSLIPIHHWGAETTRESLKKKSRFYLGLGEKKVREQPNHGQAWWELAVAESITGYRHRAIKSIKKALSLGFVQQNTLITLARCYNMEGQPKKANFAFEKAVCFIYKNLTHTNPELKSLEKLTGR